MSGTSIRRFNNITPVLGSRVMIDPHATVIGHVVIGDDVGIWPSVVIRGDMNKISIGKGSNIQDGCVLHVNGPKPDNDNPLTIGENVTVGHNATLHGCTIGNHVLIGMGSIILDGAIIEDNVLVGVGSLVTSNKRLKSGYLYMGSPAKAVRELTEDEIRYFMTSAENYIALKDKYLAQSKTSSST